MTYADIKLFFEPLGVYFEECFKVSAFDIINSCLSFFLKCICHIPLKFISCDVFLFSEEVLPVWALSIFTYASSKKGS